jgi:hypothetical protein
VRRLVRDLTKPVSVIASLPNAQPHTLAAPPSASHWALVTYIYPVFRARLANPMQHPSEFPRAHISHDQMIQDRMKQRTA